MHAVVAGRRAGRVGMLGRQVPEPAVKLERPGALKPAEQAVRRERVAARGRAAARERAAARGRAAARERAVVWERAAASGQVDFRLMPQFLPH